MRTICVIFVYRDRAHQLLENRKNNKKLGIKANWSSCLYLQRQRSINIAEEVIVKEATEQIASKMNGSEWQTSFFTLRGVLRVIWEHSNLSPLTVHLRHLLAFTDRQSSMAVVWSPQLFSRLWWLFLCWYFFTLLLMAQGQPVCLTTCFQAISNNTTKLMPDSHITTLMSQLPLWKIIALLLIFPPETLRLIDFAALLGPCRNLLRQSSSSWPTNGTVCIQEGLNPQTWPPAFSEICWTNWQH